MDDEQRNWLCKKKLGHGEQQVVTLQCVKNPPSLLRIFWMPECIKIEIDTFLDNRDFKTTCARW